MKKILIITVLLMAIVGISTASGKSQNLHGEFKGYPIIKITSDGKEIQSTKTPSILFQDEVYVPANILKKIGITTVSDSRAQSMDLSKINRIYKLFPISVKQIYESTKEFGVDSVYIVSKESDNEIVFNLSGEFEDLSKNAIGFSKVILNGGTTDTSVIRIIDTGKNDFTVPTETVKKFIEGKIQDKELWKFYKLNGKSLL